MPVSDADQERVTRLLLQDAEATVGHGHQALVREIASWERPQAHDADEYMHRVVGYVQQAFHDSYIDTTWPRCPRHPHHPLWLHEGWWRCDRDGVAVAKLGELAASLGAG